MSHEVKISVLGFSWGILGWGAFIHSFLFPSSKSSFQDSGLHVLLLFLPISGLVLASFPL